MATSETQVTSLYQRILIPLGIIYTEYVNAGKGPDAPPSFPTVPVVGRVFSAIPLRFGSIMGGQLGIFLGDLESERLLYETYDTDRTAVVINVTRINQYASDITKSGVCLLLAHELGHAFRWYLGHSGGSTGYTNEPWARTLELAYVEALQTSIHADWLGVSFEETVEFIKKYRKSLYKNTAYERRFYSSLTDDEDWGTKKSKSSGPKCPVGDPNCHHPSPLLMFHKSCTPP